MLLANLNEKNRKCENSTFKTWLKCGFNVSKGIRSVLYKFPIVVLSEKSKLSIYRFSIVVVFLVDKKKCLFCRRTGSLLFRLSKLLVIDDDYSIEVIHDPLVSICEFKDVTRPSERFECRGENCNEHPNEHPGDSSPLARLACPAI